jgi:ribonuclease Z
MFGVTILGNNSAVPAYNRHPSAQIVTIHDQLILFDCGEATQFQIAHYKVKWNKIKYIFISHLHGDHYFGLIGLISSMYLLGRKDPLYLYSPAALKSIIDLQLQVADCHLPYDLVFIPLTKDGIVLEEDRFIVECFATQHRIESRGFVVREKNKPRKINKETINNYNIPTHFYENLKEGDDYRFDDGTVVKNEFVTIPNSPSKSYAYTADTVFDVSIATKVKGVTLLYHESTYLKHMAESATLRFHSTTHQAATIALMAGVKKLIIGHFSSKYESIEVFLQEASEVFPNTDLALEGATFMV